VAQAFPHDRKRLFTTAVQDHKELIIGPTTDNVCSPQIAYKGSSDDPQQGRSGVWSESGAEVLQTLQPEAHQGKGSFPLSEGYKCLAQVGFRLCPTGDASDVVDAAG
jgi:hypothetical protein